MGVPTDKLRSGDRLLPTVLVSGLSLKQLTVFLDPFIVLMMKNMDKYGVKFEDPEAWKDSLVGLIIVLGTGLLAYLHMSIIRKSDNGSSNSEGEKG